MEPSLVIFDVDGTLIDSQDTIVRAAHFAFESTGHPVPERSEILSIVGLSLVEAIGVLAPHLSRDEHDELAARYRESFVANRAKAAPEDHPPLYPGALAALQRLGAKPDRVLGIATGKARRGVDHLFKIHPIGDFFTTIQTADVHPSKPHPSMIEAAMAETGISPGRTVFVGDTSFDMEMGRHAAVATIGVDWGYHPRARLEQAGAGEIISTYEALDAAIDRAIGGGADG